ncbi:MAG: hypothetical protein AB1805_07025 [Nitrospirota bacterium]
MIPGVERFIIEPAERFLEKVALFLPNLFSSLLILAVGACAAWLTKHIVLRILRMMKLAELSERSGVEGLLLKGGIREPFAAVAGRLAGWLVFSIFILISLSTLTVPAVERLLERMLLYLPNLFVALAIVVIGVLLANFFGRAALIASVNAGLAMAGLIGKTVKLAVFLFTLSVALEQLGIGKETVLLAFGILFGGVVLALALAFGLGGREAAQSYIEKKLFSEEERDDIHHL